MTTDDADELRDHYDFDYARAKPNRFYDFRTMRGVVRGKYAGRAKPALRSVRLDPDLAAVFTTEEAVNAALREYLRTHRTPTPVATDTGA